MNAFLQKINTDVGRKRVFHMLIGGIILSFVLYGFAIASTTLSVADAETSNHNINELQTEIAELEVAYFSMINELSLDQAADYGLNQVDTLKYVHVNQPTAVAYNR